MDIALVTGAASNPGLAIAKRLVSLGLKVFGIDNDFSACFWKHPDFSPVICDPANPEQIESAYQQILEKESSISMVIHCGAFNPQAPVESLHPKEIAYASSLLIQCPILLTRLSIPQLIKTRGQILFIESAIHPQKTIALNAGINGFINAYANALFHEVRDTGIKVTVIKQQPNINKGEESYSHSPKQDEIDPEVIADTVETLVRLPEHNSITQLVIRPQATRSEPHIANLEPRTPKGAEYVQLPTKEKFPTEPEPIPTPEAQRPEYSERIRQEIGAIEEEEDDPFDIEPPQRKKKRTQSKSTGSKKTVRKPEAPTEKEIDTPLPKQTPQKPAPAPVNALKYLGIIPADNNEMITEYKPSTPTARSKPRAQRATPAEQKKETSKPKAKASSTKAKTTTPRKKTVAKRKPKAKAKPKVEKNTPEAE